MDARLYTAIKNDRLEVGVLDGNRQEGDKVHIIVSYNGRILDSESSMFIRVGETLRARAFFIVSNLIRKMSAGERIVSVSTDVRGLKAVNIALPILELAPQTQV